MKKAAAAEAALKRGVRERESGDGGERRSLAHGNLLVGALGDRLGSRATLGLTLWGDVLLFSLTAFSTGTGMLLGVRFAAGLSSPLVPSLLYIFERARDKMHALEGVNAYSMSVNLGKVFVYAHTHTTTYTPRLICSKPCSITRKKKKSRGIFASV